MSKRIRKAVFPVAGLGTRFLPATKTVPKEMLPIIDRPLIQYAVDEAIEAGCDTLVFITNRYKHAVADYFDKAYELEQKLERAGKQEQLELIRHVLPNGVRAIFVTQAEALGLGHAVLCAKAVIGDEPFAVLLPDDLIWNRGAGALKQMADLNEASGASVIAVEDVPHEKTASYGIVATEAFDGRKAAFRRSSKAEAGGRAERPGGGRPLCTEPEDLRAAGTDPDRCRRRDPADRCDCRAVEDRRGRRLSFRGHPFRLRHASGSGGGDDPLRAGQPEAGRPGAEKLAAMLAE